MQAVSLALEAGQAVRVLLKVFGQRLMATSRSSLVSLDRLPGCEAGNKITVHASLFCCQRIPVGGNVSAANLISQVKPVYPAGARELLDRRSFRLELVGTDQVFLA